MDYDGLSTKALVEKIAEVQEQLGAFSQVEQELRVALKRAQRLEGRECSKVGWVQIRCERPQCPYRELRRIDRRTMGFANRLHKQG